MPRRDVYHYQIREALEKDGWTITDDPLDLTTGSVDLYADLGADLLAAEKETVKIAVEIKSFTEEQSPVSEFHKAIGQYDTYGFALEDIENDRIIYLAIPLSAWDGFFKRSLIQRIVKEKPLRIIVVDIIQKKVIKWIK